MAVERAYASRERLVRGVVERRAVAFFISCEPDCGGDEEFQREYVEAPGNTVSQPSYWLPRRSRRWFASTVDIASGVGYDRAAAARFHQLRRVVSNHGVFDFDTPPRTRAMDSPGVVTRDLTDAEPAWKANGTRTYHELARRSVASLRLVTPLSTVEPDRGRGSTDTGTAVPLRDLRGADE